MSTDASCTTPRADVHVDSASHDEATVRVGLSWRHLATVLLLILTLPVFAGAALVCLPVLVVGVLGQQLLKIIRLQPTAQRAPARMARVR